jgi:hypothetical protein
MLMIKALSIPILLLSFGLMSDFPALAQANKADSPSVSKRVVTAKSLILILEADATDLTSFARGTESWESQAENERRISQDTSNSIETARELHEMKAIASPGQFVIIHRVTLLIGDLVDNTRLTTQHPKDHPSVIHSGPCVGYIAAHEEIATPLASLIVEAIGHPTNSPEGVRDPARSRLNTGRARTSLP